MKIFGRKNDDFVYKGCSAFWDENQNLYNIYDLNIFVGDASTKAQAKNIIDYYAKKNGVPE